LAPFPQVDGFQAWWRRASRRTPKTMRKGLDSLVILTACSIWKYRTRCVFDGCQPRTQAVLRAGNPLGHGWSSSVVG
ncbi:hypothetical protein BAE44_0006875, partial [Dichanthelium oligosanthes]